MCPLGTLPAENLDGLPATHGQSGRPSWGTRVRAMELNMEVLLASHSRKRQSLVTDLHSTAGGGIPVVKGSEEALSRAWTLGKYPSCKTGSCCCGRVEDLCEGQVDKLRFLSPGQWYAGKGHDQICALENHSGEHFEGRGKSREPSEKAVHMAHERGGNRVQRRTSSRIARHWRFCQVGKGWRPVS